MDRLARGGPSGDDGRAEVNISSSGRFDDHTTPTATSDTPHRPDGQLLPTSKAGRGPGTTEKRLPAREWLSSNLANAGVDALLRLLVGGAFVLAGVLKIADPAKFAMAVANYRLFPHETLNLVAILVPPVEVAAGLFVLAGVWLRAAALVIVWMTALFLLLITSALARGLNIECGCFGTVGGRHVGLFNLGIDSLLLLFAALLARRASRGRPEKIFGDAGSQISAPPNEASLKASSAN